MARIARCGMVLGLLIALAPSAQAFGGRLFGSSSNYNSGYYSPPYAAGYYSASYYPAYYSSYYPTYGMSYYNSAAYSYYLPAYSYYVPVYTLAPSMVPCVQPKAAPVYAQPYSAPPSQTPEPPSDTPTKPKVKEFSKTSFYNAGYAGDTAEKSASDTCKVGFWNLSGQGVTLRVNGQVHYVPVNKGVTLILPRQFAWQRDQQAPQMETVPGDRANLEIVLR